MAFRTLEIRKPAEVHVRRGQLEIANQEGTVSVPLEDLATIVCSGANIRMSTMAQAQIAEAGITLMIIDEKYRPSCILVPVESNVRQTQIIRSQIALPAEGKNMIWKEILVRKIENQARALTILGREGAERVLKYISDIDFETIDASEANAAREYFSHLHPGLNRRSSDPVNSCLNYGYAVIRNAIIRSVMLAGFQPAIGIHHDNPLNPFTLADDLIEPWRAMVDIIALRDPGTSMILSRERRRSLASVLHQACLVNGTKLSVLAGIDEMTGSLRNRIVLGSVEKLKLPVILPEEMIDAVRE